jgi:hypothetical protein
MYETLSCMRFLFTLTLAASLIFAAELAISAPEQSGFSRERIHRINTIMQEHVMAGDMVGASGLLTRNGKIVFRENWGEMKQDSIVRMYSMTKAATGVAAMILYEEGKFSLTDPVSKYIRQTLMMKVYGHAGAGIHKASSSLYLLTGLLKCGTCGANLVIVVGKGRKTKRKYYACSQRSTGGPARTVLRFARTLSNETFSPDSRPQC